MATRQIVIDVPEKVLLEAKSSGLIESVKPVIHRLEKSGMWVSEDIRRRVLALAGES